MITREDAQAALRAGKCFCGNWKESGDAFCLRDYLDNLTKEHRRGLFMPVGRGFEAAYAAAKAAIIEKRTANGEQL